MLEEVGHFLYPTDLGCDGRAGKSKLVNIQPRPARPKGIFPILRAFVNRKKLAEKLKDW